MNTYTTEQIQGLEHDATKLAAWLENFARAQRVLTAASSLGRGYREQAQAEANAIVTQARERAEQQASEIISRADTTATARIAKAKEDAEAIRSASTADAASALRQLTKEAEAKQQELDALNTEIAAATAQLSVLEQRIHSGRGQLRSGVSS